MENIKASAFDEYINDNFAKTEVVEIGGVQVEVKHHLSLSEMLDLTDYVVNNCFQGENDAYMPQLKDFLFRAGLIQKYTNIELPDNISEQYDFLYQSDIISKIIECINPNEIRNILDAIDLRISHEQTVQLDEYRKKIEEIYSSILEMNRQAEELYKDMSSDDMADLISALANASNGNVSSEELAKAMMKYKKEADS